MNYSEAIEWLREHDVKKDDGTYYEFGEVTAEHSTSFSCSAHLIKSLKCLISKKINQTYSKQFKFMSAYNPLNIHQCFIKF